MPVPCMHISTWPVPAVSRCNRPTAQAFIYPCAQPVTKGQGHSIAQSRSVFTLHLARGDPDTSQAGATLFPFLLPTPPVRKRMAGRSAPRRLALFCLLASCIALAARTSDASRRELGISIGNGGGGGIGIGIGIGGGGGYGGGGSPSPTPPSSYGPKASDFENERLYRAYLVIQRFKQTITCDTQGITKTWTGTAICSDTSYLGFFCEKPPNVNERALASVDFNGFKLEAPTVEGFVDALPDLALFHANSNDFGGVVPILRSLQYFYELDVSNNKLARCAFPTDVLGVTNATFVDIRFNRFYGEVPAGLFCSFPIVEAIFVNNNQFSGKIPSNLGDSPVNYLALANNQFTGPIPSSIGRAANTLLEVLFLNNKLSGCLPYELGLLAKATVIDAGTNQLTGTIPASYACLRKVEQLNLADNLLYGEVPDALCRLAYPSSGGHLSNLTLSDNYFTSLGSCCWALIKQGKLNVARNCIPYAPNQRSHEECAGFFHTTKTYCPVSTYVPCHHPKDYTAGKEEASAAEEYKYRTYSALHP
ncbi:unnamed protein product [Triticum turgidum subsp. durum]|uniref:Leucine-rich repeat-containing N-terminal plant-type domain-containing protein n=1 Tax=Triticum turgidum subsp. durum TaxID=4567 RepID=A0A9R1PTE8_TRITD|nr:unnamed protein product [Triticum turgidum subsp. durum]